MSSYIVGDQEYRTVEHDDRHDESTDRVDAGEECPTCHGTHGITEGMRHGLPCFTCDACGQSWYDAVTQPPIDTQTLDMFPELAMYMDRL